jgi:CubicO group peptidase (beta-lactamase class C family)
MQAMPTTTRRVRDAISARRTLTTATALAIGILLSWLAPLEPLLADFHSQNQSFAAEDPPGPSSAKGRDPALEESIDAAVAAQMKIQKVPGAALAIIRKGEVALVKGYGEANVEHHVPVTPDTIFQSGSIGKQFTAAAIMTLVDDGKISLDDSVVKFYPDVAKWWYPVTIRHLLTHTSGMDNFEPGIQIDYRKDYTDADFAKLAFALTPQFAPGSRWNYSNPGYILLGCIIDKVTGHHYGELLRDRVFKPLGMKTARIISETDIIPHRAEGYQLVKGELKNQDWNSPSVNSTADGALYLTVRDMIAWDKGIRAKAVLKAESWKKVFTPVVLKSGKTYPYGFGWFIDGDRGQLRQHHGGAWQGFKAYISRYLGDDFTVILLTNLANTEPDVFTDAIAAVINPKLALPNLPLGDQEPAIAKRVRALLAEARAGTLTAADFVLLPAGYFPTLATLHEQLLAPLGEPKSLQLVERHDRGDDRWYRWHAAFKGKTLEVTLSLAPNDKLSWFYVKPIN